MTKRILTEFMKIAKEIDKKDNLAEVYARYDNWLREECDADDYNNQEFLRQIVNVLKDKIVKEYMKSNNYYPDSDDLFERWKKVESYDEN